MIKSFIKKRLKETSTWRALVGILTLFGLSLTDEQQALVATAGAALYLAVEAFLPDTIESRPSPAVNTTTHLESSSTLSKEEASTKEWDGKVPGSML